jgi:hypothetical protein
VLLTRCHEVQTRPACNMFYDMCKQVSETLGAGLVCSAFMADCPLYVYYIAHAINRYIYNKECHYTTHVCAF